MLYKYVNGNLFMKRDDGTVWVCLLSVSNRDSSPWGPYSNLWTEDNVYREDWVTPETMSDVKFKAYNTHKFCKFLIEMNGCFYQGEVRAEYGWKTLLEYQQNIIWWDQVNSRMISQGHLYTQWYSPWGLPVVSETWFIVEPTVFPFFQAGGQIVRVGTSYDGSLQERNPDSPAGIGVQTNDGWGWIHDIQCGRSSWRNGWSRTYGRVWALWKEENSIFENRKICSIL